MKEISGVIMSNKIEICGKDFSQKEIEYVFLRIVNKILKKGLPKNQGSVKL